LLRKEIRRETTDTKTTIEAAAAATKKRETVAEAKAEEMTEVRPNT
jgi:hypothetical protein